MGNAILSLDVRGKALLDTNKLSQEGVTAYKVSESVTNRHETSLRTQPDRPKRKSRTPPSRAQAQLKQ